MIYKTFSITIIFMVAALSLTFSQTVKLDSTFNSTGIVMHPVSSINDEIRAIVLQPDGKIVAAGLSYQVNPTMICALSRYLPDGALDTSFSIDGKLTDSYGQLSCSFQSVALQPDGKIVTAGVARDTITLKDNIGVARYFADGTNDSTFGFAGKIMTDYFCMNDQARGVVIQPDGKIVAAGSTGDTLFNNYMAIVRYNSDGSPDTTFGNNGKQFIDFGTDAGCTSLAMQADGKFVLSGARSMPGNANVALARINSDGSLDSTFGINGMQTLVTSYGLVSESVAIQPDGKIVTAGYAILNPPYYDFAVERFLSNGDPDSTFSSDGIETTSFGPYNDYPRALIIQPDGKIIVAGSTSSAGLQNDFALARYTSDGSLDSTFGINGELVTPLSTGFETIYSLKLQIDGKLVAAGFAEAGGQRQFTVVRYITDLNLGMIDFDQSENSILIYPNPIEMGATLEYELKTNETVSIKLLDMQGKTLKYFMENENQSNGKHVESIFLGDEFSAGCYLLQLSNGIGQVAVRVLKR